MYYLFVQFNCGFFWEAGEIPARPRHCNRDESAMPLAARLRRRAIRMNGSQETCPHGALWMVCLRGRASSKEISLYLRNIWHWKAARRGGFFYAAEKRERSMRSKDGD